MSVLMAAAAAATGATTAASAIAATAAGQLNRRRKHRGTGHDRVLRRQLAGSHWQAEVEGE